jgi:hypothetical protein
VEDAHRQVDSRPLKLGSGTRRPKC